MKMILYFILLFALPHANWIPYKLGLNPEQIPLGVGNWILILSIILFYIGRKNERIHNPLKIYTLFISIVVLGVFIGIINEFEDINTTLTISKSEITLMLLFYLPLYNIKDDDEFTKLFIICLIVHFLVGLEVYRSGMLLGSNFNDSKRGSGPFSLGWQGSDIAGSYLCQVIMFSIAILSSREIPTRTRCIAGLCSFTMLLGILATYARGAIIALVAGIIMIIVSSGITIRTIVIIAIAVLMVNIYLPDSVSTRFNSTTTETGQLDVTVTGRFDYYESALKIILENPLGVGTGQVRAAMQKVTSKYVDPHNGILYTACEYGIIGLCVLMLMLYKIISGSLKIIKDKAMPLVYRIYAKGMIGFVTALFICNMSYANFYKDTVIGTVVIHIGMFAFALYQMTNRQVLSSSEGVN